jgi:hypothetical protein
MRHVDLPFFELALVAGTRVALGVGLGLLVADQFDRQTRRTLGCTLAGIGALSTIPLALDILKNRTSTARHFDQPSLATLAR